MVSLGVACSTRYQVSNDQCRSSLRRTALWYPAVPGPCLKDVIKKNADRIFYAIRSISGVIEPITTISQCQESFLETGLHPTAGYLYRPLPLNTIQFQLS